MTESCEQNIYSQQIIYSNSNNNGYINFVLYVTPEIIDDLTKRGWVENASNKVIVRYIANGKWQSLTEDEKRRWNKGHDAKGHSAL